MTEHFISDQLNSYLHQTLTDAEREEMDRHLAECAACRARLDSCEALQRRLRYTLTTELRGVHPSAEMTFAAIAPRLKPSRRLTMVLKQSNQLIYGMVTTALLVAMGVALYFFASHLSRPTTKFIVVPPASTPSLSATFTSVPPTATPTASSTVTFTPVPPTVTPTPTPQPAEPLMPPGSLLNAIWGNSASDVFAVGYDGDCCELILHYDGQAWSTMSQGTGYWLNGVWSNSSSDVFAVGAYGKIMHYDGKTWSRMQSNTNKTLITVWGSSGSNVFAVGENGAILHYDGQVWSPMESGWPVKPMTHPYRQGLGTSVYINGVWGSSGSDVFATTDYGAILHYDGKTWSQMNSGVTYNLGPVWGSSGSDVFAAGDKGTILHYDGKAWSPISSGTTDDVYALWGSSGSDVLAATNNGAILHYDGQAWSLMSSTDKSFINMWGSSGSDVFAVGDFRSIMHYDGQAWLDMSSGVQAKVLDALEEALAGKYKGKIVKVGGIFGGSFESDYLQSLQSFEEKTGISVNYQQISTENPALHSMIETSTIPDIVDFDFLSPAKALAKEGKVIDLNTWMDQTTLQKQYPENWLNWATMEGPDGPIMAGLWGVYPIKGLVWYPKAAFDQAGYQVPTSWEELLALSDRIVKDGGTPWCIENEGGYQAAQWVSDIMLRTAPPVDYNKWINGELRFTSPQVKHAFQLMGDLFFKPGYTLGGREAINRTTMYEASRAIFATPPKCWLIKEPGEIVDWDGVSDHTIFDDKVFGQDYAFFVLPPIDPAYGAPVQMQAFFYSMFHDRPEVRALMQYLATGADVEAWIKQGQHFGVSPHQNATLDWYPHERERAVAELGMAAQQTGNLHYLAGEAMWPAVQSQFYKSISDYIAGKIDLDTALQQIDATWPVPVSAAPAVTPTVTMTK